MSDPRPSSTTVGPGSPPGRAGRPARAGRGPRRPLHPVFWTLAQIGSRVRVRPPAVLRPGPGALPPQTITIPTRHGPVRALVHRPDGGAADTPVVVHLHGGGFVNRFPEQDAHIAGHLAAALGVTVVLPDYATAPKVRYPVAEEQAVDLARWVRDAGPFAGWDGDRLLLSGVSAGAKLVINACRQLHDAGETAPLAVALIVPVTDVSRTDRRSSLAKPAISGFVQAFVGWSYFPEIVRQRESLASPAFDATLAEAMPPTLILTAEHDTLAPEGADLARALRDGGVEVVHHVYPGVDHDFMATARVDTARSALAELASFFQAHLPAAGS